MSKDSQFSIRGLARNDANLLRQLLHVFADAFAAQENYLDAQPTTNYLENLLDQAHFITLVAIQDTTVIGGLTAYELKKYERERSEIYIYDLAVAEDHRRRGIATKLIEHLGIIASQRGAYVIFVQADLEDTPAITLYEKHGPREDVLHFDIAVTSRAVGYVQKNRDQNGHG